VHFVGAKATESVVHAGQVNCMARAVSAAIQPQLVAWRVFSVVDVLPDYLLLGIFKKTYKFFLFCAAVAVIFVETTIRSQPLSSKVPRKFHFQRSLAQPRSTDQLLPLEP